MSKKTLEDEFKKLVNEHKAEIDAKVSEASAALGEAVKLSEKYGIPFSPSISFLHNSYYPNSFYEKKFSELDSDVVTDLTDAYSWSDYGDSAGWEHSAVC